VAKKQSRNSPITLVLVMIDWQRSPLSTWQT
jgi:hypothetical protein